MDVLTINEAAQTTGWSPRMLRYVERGGLVDPARSAGGYRLYGPAELQRLRTLRELLDNHDLTLTDMAFAERLRREPALRAAVDEWFAAEPQRPESVPAESWLRFEQDKHQRLLELTGTEPHDGPSGQHSPAGEHGADGGHSAAGQLSPTNQHGPTNQHNLSTTQRETA